MSAAGIVVVVLTLNEERHLPGCLASLRALTDDVLVLDSGSRDRTVEIAEAAGARVAVRPFRGYAAQRNEAFHIAGDAAWVCFIDADERLLPAGAREIARAVAAASDGVAALAFPRVNVFWGCVIRGGGWWPDYQTRIFRRGRARFDERRQVHELAVVDGATARLREPLLHLNYDTRREFVAKQRAYTRLRVEQSRAAGVVPRRRAYLGAPARELHRRFVALGGWRDGADGVFLAGTLALEELRAVRLIRRGAS